MKKNYKKDTIEKDLKRGRMAKRKRKLKKKMKQKLIVIGILATIVFLLIGGITLYFIEREKNRVSNYIHFDTAYGVMVATELIPTPSISRTGDLRKIKYIVIHETDNFSSDATAYNHSLYLQQVLDVNSWHYTVDELGVYRHVPDNEIAWHAGNAEGNQYGIGIELCVNSGSDFEVTFDNAARLVAKLLKEYKLPISAIKQHYDFSGKDCPAKIRAEDRMDEFIELVKYYLTIEE